MAFIGYWPSFKLTETYFLLPIKCALNEKIAMPLPWSRALKVY
jgi:hypothetical protein